MTTKKCVLLCSGAAGLLVLVGISALYYWMGKAMYEPGALAAKPPADFEPPANHFTERNYWQVTPGVKLYHFAEGEGQDVLVVHGGPGLPPLKAWRATEILGANFRFHFYHQRGCGKSTHPINKLTDKNLYQRMMFVERELGLGAQIADIERMRRLLGHNKLVLIGHSFGALIAALYAAEFPDHVRSLVFVSPADLVVFPKERDDLFQIVGRRLPADLKNAYQEYMRDYFDFKTLFEKDEGELARFFGRFSQFYSAANGNTGVDRIIGDTEDTGGGWMPLGVYLSLGKRHDFRAALARVTVPVLVIHGSKDMIPARDSRQFAEYFRGARFIEIDGAGHFSFEDRPQQFATAVRDFLDSTIQGVKR